MRATREEVAAMRARLQDRMDQRRHDAEDREVIGIVNRRPFVEAKEQEVMADAVEDTKESPWAQIALMAAWAVCELVRGLTTEDWLLALVLAVTGLVLFGMRMI